MKKLFIVILLCLITILLHLFIHHVYLAKHEQKRNHVEGEIYKLYFLGGQSNMVGYGFNKDLPTSLNKTFENVWIFHGNNVEDNDPTGGLGKWEQLKPGNGTGFKSDGKINIHSDRFGLELSFSQKMLEKDSTSKIAIIKYAKGGSSLEGKASKWGTWNPDFDKGNRINQYDNFLTTLNNAFKVQDINGDGTPDKLIPSGILWMQGEKDAEASLEAAQNYKYNLKQMMGLMRSALRSNDLPIVIGLIADSWMNDGRKMMDHLEVVQQAQRDFIKEVKYAVIVEDTQNYNFLKDRWHYTSESYIDLGEKFAEAIWQLEILQKKIQTQQK